MTVPTADVARRSERVRFRRALTLLAMTLLLPGSAQLMCGNKAVGRAALRVLAILVFGGLIMFAIIGSDGFVQLALQPWWLVGCEVGVVVLGLCWLALFVDAWRLGRPPTLYRPHRLAASGMSLALMAGIATPTAFGAVLLEEHRDFLQSSFEDGGVANLYNGRLNVLLLGGDGGDNREGIRTDSISLASIDVATGRTVLFSLPRNVEYAPFPPGTPMAEQFPNGFDPNPAEPDFLFGVYTYGSDNPQLFPEGTKNTGALAMQQTVAQMLGVPVHYYALVNLAGFRNVVDALGGVTLRVEERLPIGGGRSLTGVSQPILGYIEPGLQELDGYQALWYSRSRATTTDYDRMARQRCMMGAILRAADPATVLTNYRKLTRSAKQVLTTDMTLAEVRRLVGVATKAKNTKVTGVQFAPPAIDPTNPDILFIREKVQSAIAKSNAAAAAAAAAPAATADPAVEPKKKKKKKKPTAETSPAPAPTGDSVALDDTCRYS